jgi:hypothetical protein
MFPLVNTYDKMCVANFRSLLIQIEHTFKGIGPKRFQAWTCDYKMHSILQYCDLLRGHSSFRPADDVLTRILLLIKELATMKRKGEHLTPKECSILRELETYGLKIRTSARESESGILFPRDVVAEKAKANLAPMFSLVNTYDKMWVANFRSLLLQIEQTFKGIAEKAKAVVEPSVCCSKPTENTRAGHESAKVVKAAEASDQRGEDKHEKFSFYEFIFFGFFADLREKSATFVHSELEGDAWECHDLAPSDATKDAEKSTVWDSEIGGNGDIEFRGRTSDRAVDDSTLDERACGASHSPEKPLSKPGVFQIGYTLR